MNGGWGAPNIRKYYEAIALSRILDWVKNNKEKQWVKIENTMSEAELGRIVWIPPQCRKLSTEIKEITKHALKIWDNLHKREHREFNSPLIPLKNTEYFAPGKEDLFGKWIFKEDAQLKDVMRQGKMCTFQELKDKDEWFVIDFWRYKQLKHFVDSVPQPIRSMENLLPLEQIFMEKKGKGGFPRCIEY